MAHAVREGLREVGLTSAKAREGRGEIEMALSNAYLNETKNLERF